MLIGAVRDIYLLILHIVCRICFLFFDAVMGVLLCVVGVDCLWNVDADGH